ncbi:unnamed protein product [Cochlearia groenlandica]
MGVSTHHRGMILLLVIAALLVLGTSKVSSLRWERDIRLQLLYVHHPLRVLKETSSSLDTNRASAPSPIAMSEPNQSVKRMIGRGSDPIHNRC